MGRIIKPLSKFGAKFIDNKKKTLERFEPYGWNDNNKYFSKNSINYNNCVFYTNNKIKWLDSYDGKLNNITLTNCDFDITPSLTISTDNNDNTKINYKLDYYK